MLLQGAYPGGSSSHHGQKIWAAGNRTREAARPAPADRRLIGIAAGDHGLALVRNCLLSID
jgi:hypothetical protein